MFARAAILAAVLLPLSMDSLPMRPESTFPPTCQSFITITQYPPSPYYQATASITVEYGFIEEGGCIPPFEGLDPWTNFRFYVNGADQTGSFTIYADQAVGTNVPLIDEATNTLTAQNLGNDTQGNPRTDSDTEITNVDTTPVPIVSTTPFNYDHQDAARCAAACFAPVYAHGTVPYVSLDANWNVTLAYHGDRVSPRPFVHVNTTVPSGANTPLEYWLKVKVNDAYQTFVNGDQEIRYTGTTQLVRLGGQLDRSTQPTQVDSLTIIVTAKWSATKTEQTIVTTRLTTVNENTSRIGRGWTVAGVMRLYSQANGSMLLTEGDGSAVFYHKPCPTCTFTTPVGEFRQLSTNYSGWKLVYPDTTTVYFNSAGRDTLVTDRFGNQVRFFYDGSNRLWKVRDPLGRDIVLAYGTYGLASITDPMGRVTTITVASDSTLRAIKDPDGDSTRFTYDASKRLATLIDRRGGTTQFFYRTSSWKLDSIRLPAIPINGGGSQSPRIALSPWQIVGVPTTSTSSTPFTPVLASSVQGSVTDPEGHAASFTADRWGQPLVLTDALNRTTTFTRHGNGLATSIAYPWGSTESYTYDASGRVTLRSATGVAATNIRYGAKGQPDSVWGSAQATQKFFLHTSTGRADSVMIAGLDSLKFRVWYNGRGQVTKVKDPKNDSTLFHYDTPFANRDSVLAQGNRYVRARFDVYGRDSAVTANGLPWSRVIYDLVNRPRQLYDGVNGNPTILGYDQLFLIRVQDPKNQVYRFANNALGLPTQRFDPADTLNRFDAYRYNRDGLLTGWTNRRNQALSFSYDTLHRLRAKSGTNTVADSFAYSTDGRRIVAWNAVARDSVSLSVGLWRDSTVTRLAGKRFRVRYHVNGVAATDSIVITNTAGISFVTRRFFRNVGSQRIDSLGLNALRIRTPRNADGLRNSTALPTIPVVSRVSTFTTLHNQLSDSLTHGGLDGTLGRMYGYDALNRLVHQTDANGPFPTGRDFFFDNLGRLTQVDYGMYGPVSPCSGYGVNDGWLCYIANPALGQFPDSTKTYAYDQVGNRTDQSGTYMTGNRVATFAGYTFAQDLDGNDTLKSGGGQTKRYAWSAEGRLQSVIVGSTTITYRYDALGRLVRRVRAAGTTDSTNLLWEGDQLLAELNGVATQRVAEYAYNPGIDRPLALITGATSPSVTRFYHQDALGNVIGVFKDTTLHQKITYGPWGEQQQVTGTLADTNRLRWKGLAWDPDGALYYMRARWYDPQTGRFLSEDPIGLEGGANQYAFGWGDPIGRRDPQGMVPLVIPVVIGGGLIAVGIITYMTYTETHNGDRLRTSIAEMASLGRRITAALAAALIAFHDVSGSFHSPDEDPNRKHDEGRPPDVPVPLPTNRIRPRDDPMNPLRRRLPGELHGVPSPSGPSNLDPWAGSPEYLDSFDRTLRCYLDNTVTTPAGTTGTYICEDGTRFSIYWPN